LETLLYVTPLQTSNHGDGLISLFMPDGRLILIWSAFGLTLSFTIFHPVACF